MTSGVMPEPQCRVLVLAPTGKDAQLIGQMLHKALTVRGIYVGSRAMFNAMNKAITRHQLEPVIDRVFSFDESPEAFRHLESAQHFGKIVIRAE